MHFCWVIWMKRHFASLKREKNLFDLFEMKVSRNQLVSLGTLFYIIDNLMVLVSLMLFKRLHEKQREIFPKKESISK